MPHPTPGPVPGNRAQQATANDRFKTGFAAWFWAGLVLATLAHIGVFVASPTFAIAGISAPTPPIVTYDIPDIKLPPEPEEIPRPAAPRLSVEAPADRTIPEMRIPDYAVDLPPVVRRNGLEPGDFTPMTLRPQLRNDRDIARLLERLYPVPLRDAGIGGTVRVWFFIDVDGRVRDTRIDESSGFDALDRAALQVADRMEFTPAYNRDDPVAVWVSIAITFEAER
jgi:periplasmic protein TonB